MWNHIERLVWGGVPSVPALGFWTAVALGAVLLVIGQRLVARGANRRTLGLAAFLLALVLPAGAAMASLPFSFTNGTVADATQVNTNFSSLDSRVTALEGKGNVFGVQRAAFQYTALTSPSMTLSLAPGSYNIVAAGCGSPSGGTFIIKSTLRISGTDTDSALLNGSTSDCFTLINAVTFDSAGTVAVIFGNGGGQGGASANIAWSRIIATPIAGASISTVTN
jgi:hypothetical protein